ncbi:MULTISPECIES: glutamine synthetase family protein [Roseobacteraceae]|uniref:Glutamine synthetase n=1 Tax=Pseudosulfitobacter pseudonitzschiae TaxID=1402135 RepID=A0A221JWN2_9RHOB|nr:MULTISPECIES: glutamine synthetase family protein [Roseobacteraceae]ASM71116.1 glutamine synthetase [Pseudosulfitobacter pseudonitzschiae]
MTHRTRVLFADLLNLPRGKYVATSLADGGKVGFARGLFGVTFDRDLIPVPGAGVLEGIPDVDLHLDAARRSSWQDGTDIALGTLHVHGEVFGLCPRGRLKQAVADWKAQGLTPMIGLEMEAYVFEQDESGAWVPYDTPGAFVYGTGPQNDPAGLFDVIWEAAQRAGLPLESLNGEYDSGQFELTLCFDDALKACDDAFLFRTMAREIAFDLGLMLTFLPKPVPERGGSGLHVNFSLVDETGSNVIAPDGALSEVAKQAMAGLIAHHEALAGLLAVTTNSYDRLGPASMAGYWANWAEDHRLVTTRCSTASPKSARLEHRMADCAANPYLAVAAILQAALLGMKTKLELQPAEDMDGLENTRETRHTPDDLGAALDALEADTDLCAAVGEDLCAAMIVLKRDEIARLEGKSTDEVRAFYLPFV